MHIESLKKRRDFLRLSAKGEKCHTHSFILITLPGAEPAQESARFGYTVTKKVGNAVVRNRIKRRLREAVREVAPEMARPGHDYSFIARKNALLCDYSTLLRDLRYALNKLHAPARTRHAPPAV